MSDWKPNTTMSPAAIAVPAVPDLNLNFPATDRVPGIYRRDPGAANSPNPNGGYVPPSAFANPTPRSE